MDESLVQNIKEILDENNNPACTIAINADCTASQGMQTVVSGYIVDSGYETHTEAYVTMYLDEYQIMICEGESDYIPVGEEFEDLDQYEVPYGQEKTKHVEEIIPCNALDEIKRIINQTNLSEDDINKELDDTLFDILASTTENTLNIGFRWFL